MWEYRAVRWPHGTYTEYLNEYAAEGWELVQVVSDAVPAPTPGRRLPVPSALGRSAAADTINRLGGVGDDAPTEPSSLLWILRRPRPSES